jgi:2-dehydro-3-deoxyglucarate aldolase
MRDDITLKARLASRELTIGSWLSFGFTPVCEMMAKAGFEWLVIDMEHTAISVADQLQLIQIIELAQCVPLVRVGANDPLLIKRALDAGAHGVVVPMINSVEDARRAVASTYYPPHGRRGAGLGRAHAYGLDFSAYKDRADRDTALVVQIEHIEGVGALEAILAVDGVDAFIIGPYDLTGSLGRPGMWDDPEVRAALDNVERIMGRSSKPGGFHVVHSDREELMERIESGYRFIAYGDDMVFLAEKLRDEAEFVRTLARRRDL